MSDLISRADAIKAVCRDCLREYEEDKCEHENECSMKKALVELPSAVPSAEPSKCEDCEYWNDTEDGCADRHGCYTDTDLISRAQALEEIAQAECGLHYVDCEADNCSCSYIKRILDIPSADKHALPTEMNGVKISDAIKWADEWLNEYATGREWSCVRALRDFTETALMELPSDEQVTSKLKNPCDSLLTEDFEDSKEQKSKLDSDLISRKDAVKAIADYFIGIRGTSTINHYEDAKVILNTVPSVSADRQSGEWQSKLVQYTDGSHGYRLKCSACGEEWISQTAYCPNCGAKMVSK